MLNTLKQSAAVVITFGPFVDKTDGVTLKTGLVSALDHASTGIMVSKNGGTLAVRHATVTASVYDAHGNYKVTLDTTDTATLGTLRVIYTDAATCLPVWRDFTVLPAMIYDSLVANSDRFDVNVTHITDQSQTARDIGASVLVGDKTGFSLSSAGVQAIWDALTSALTTVGSIGKRLVDYITGDIYARIGSPAGASISADIASNKTDLTTLLGRLTSSRAGYLDNLNVGGPVASQADITAINESASRRIILTSVGQYERPESGSTTYTIEARTFTGDGAAVNADSTPTLTGTGQTSGSLAANISAASNPATGVYRWTYTVSSSATIEPCRFDVSATISSSTFTLSLYTQVVDLVSATWTTADATKLTAIYNKLPSKSFLAGSNNSDGDVQMDEATGNFAGSVGSIAAGGITSSSFSSGAITSSAFASGAITASAFAANALTGPKGDTTYYASIAQAVWQLTSTTAFGTVGSVGNELDGYLSNIETLVSDIGSVIHKYETVYYVSASSGNDSDSGLTSSAAKLTLTAAKTAAASGSLIIVMPGTYNEKNLFKTGVDWYFARGAIVNYTGSGTGGMFDDSSLGANGAVVCRVFGYGRFIHATSHTSTVAPTLRVANASSRVLFKCLDISNTSPLGSSPYGISHEAGALDVKVIGTISSTNVGSVTGGSSGRFTCEADTYSGGVTLAGSFDAYIKGRFFYCPGANNNCVYLNGSPKSCIVEAEYMYGYRAVYIDFDSQNYTATVYAKRMEGTGDAGIIEADGSGQLCVVGAYITANSATGPAVYAVSATLHLRDCTIRNFGAGADIYVDGTVSVTNCDYRRSKLVVNGTFNEAPPADYVTSTYGKVDTEVAAIKAKTDSLPSDPADASDIAALLATITGFVDTEVAAIKTVTDQLVSAQAEPVAVPAANATPLQKLAWLAMLARNKITQTATTQIVKADDGTTTVGTATVSDDATTFTRGEFA